MERKENEKSTLVVVWRETEDNWGENWNEDLNEKESGY